MATEVKEKTSVTDLRSRLVDSGYEEGYLKTLSKSQLKAMVDALSIGELVLDTAVPEDEAVISVKGTQELTTEPSMGSPGWTPFIMAKFEASELDNGMPRVDALRRMAYEVLGSFSSETDVIQVPHLENAGRATVKVRLTFADTGSVIDGAADVFSGNTAKEFSLHAVATAETRAEGRALRKALMLTKILSAEELQNADSDEANGTDTRIVSSLLTSLTIMADRQGIDLLKLAISNGHDIQSLDELTNKEGLNLSKELGAFQRKEKEITDAIKK